MKDPNLLQTKSQGTFLSNDFYYWKGHNFEDFQTLCDFPSDNSYINLDGSMDKEKP
jgi:hypothetical protein